MRQAQHHLPLEEEGKDQEAEPRHPSGGWRCTHGGQTISLTEKPSVAFPQRTTLSVRLGCHQLISPLIAGSQYPQANNVHLKRRTIGAHMHRCLLYNISLAVLTFSVVVNNTMQILLPFLPFPAPSSILPKGIQENHFFLRGGRLVTDKHPLLLYQQACAS